MQVRYRAAGGGPLRAASFRRWVTWDALAFCRRAAVASAEWKAAHNRGPTAGTRVAVLPRVTTASGTQPTLGLNVLPEATAETAKKYAEPSRGGRSGPQQLTNSRGRLPRLNGYQEPLQMPRRGRSQLRPVDYKQHTGESKVSRPVVRPHARCHAWKATH